MSIMQTPSLAQRYLHDNVASQFFIYKLIPFLYLQKLDVLQDKDEIQKLSPSEQRKRLLEIVAKIDTDSDKYLSPGRFWFAANVWILAFVRITKGISLDDLEEITLWIQRVYRRYALDDAEERFPEFDSNNDGLVSWDEYNMFMHGHTVKLGEDAVLEDPEEESLRFVCCPNINNIQ